MRAAASLLAASVLLGPLGAAAQDDDDRPLMPAAEEGAQERARIHFQAGASYYEAGAYEDALREWTRAHELSPRPELLYNLSLAHQGLGQLREARDHLARYLAAVEDIPNRANLELRLESFDRRIAEADADPEPPPPRGDNLGAIAGFAIAGAGALTFAVFGGLTLGEDARLQNRCATPCGPGAANDLRAYALVADLGIAVTLAGATMGVLFLVLDTGGDDDGEAPAAAALPWVSPSGGGVTVAGRL